MAQPAESKKTDAKSNPVAAFFVNSVMLDEERLSVAVGKTCDGIEPGNNGVFLTRVFSDRGRGAKVSRRIFVPWANVRTLQFEDAPVEA